MIFLEADAERDTTATAATWRVVLLGMHEATAAVAVATASCNCAPWGRLTCALRHEPDPCQSFCCDAFHRCPRGGSKKPKSCSISKVSASMPSFGIARTNSAFVTCVEERLRG